MRYHYHLTGLATTKPRTPRQPEYWLACFMGRDGKDIAVRHVELPYRTDELSREEAEQWAEDHAEQLLWSH
jgi:hypothetical protein